MQVGFLAGREFAPSPGRAPRVFRLVDLAAGRHSFATTARRTELPMRMDVQKRPAQRQVKQKQVIAWVIQKALPRLLFAEKVWS